MEKEIKNVQCFHTPEEMLKAIIQASKNPKACIFLPDSISEDDFGEGVSLKTVECGLAIWVRLTVLKIDYGDTEVIFGTKDYPDPENTYFFRFYS